MSGSERRRSLLTTDEASALLRCSGRTLERWRTSGGGPRYIKAGPGAKSRVFYAREDIEDWMRRKTFTNTSEYLNQSNATMTGARGDVIRLRR